VPEPGEPSAPPRAPAPQLVVGLGNPGPAYRSTRHNVGQAVADRLAERLGGRFQPRGPALVAGAHWRQAPLYLAKPMGFMNVVGPGVARLLGELGLDPGALILVHDDLDLPFGAVRVRHRGRHGGHNGVRSVLEALQTEAIRRVKIGIGRPATREEVTDWVLTAFTPEERDALPEVIERAADAALELAAHGQGGVNVV
jgi:PTH1 family peptidyl-tRNA hydrolase